MEPRLCECGPGRRGLSLHCPEHIWCFRPSSGVDHRVVRWTSGLSPASPWLHGPVRVEQEAQRRELELFFFIPM